MEVILLQKIANLGNIGDRVKVKPGFGRNFLLPGGKATLATAENIAKFESRRAELEAQAAKELVVGPAARGGPRRLQAHDHGQGRQRGQAVRVDRHCPTSRKPARRPATPSSAPRCASRAGRSAWSAST